MHPQFVMPASGKCPKCFMDLIPLADGAAGGGRRELVLSHAAVEAAGISADVAEMTDPADASPAVLTVPEASLLRNLGRSFVFVESDNGDTLSYQLREVETGKRLGLRRAVLSGLDEGEVVAASGLFRLDSAMQILGKVSLANLPPGDLSLVDEPQMEPYLPAERSALDLRGKSGFRVDDWFGSYERLRAALAKDDNAGAAGPAEEMRKALTIAAVTPPKEFQPLFEDLTRDAESVVKAADLAARRASFEKISADMVLLARRYGPPAGGLNLVFCPMAFDGKGAHWLQPGKTVDNPYHGLEMPECGWLVEKIGDGGNTGGGE